MMFRFSNGYIALIILATISTSPTARADDYIDLNFKPDGTFAPFPSKTAMGLMTSQEFTAYKTHLDNLECDAAETILNTTFVRTYPQHSRAKNTGAPHNRNYDRWLSYARSEFMEYGYCDALLDFQITEKKLNAKNIPPNFYTPRKLQPEFFPYAKRKNVSEEQFLIERRERNIALIVGQAQMNYIPAILKIAELLRRGDVFDLSNGKEIEYYLLSRAHHLGASESPQNQRLQELSRSLSENQRRNLDQKAREKQGLITHIIDNMQPM